jgi:long-chain acyl-CoA synthetase
MTAATTLPRLLQRNAASFPERPALREKRGGIWHVLSWSEYAQLVSRVAAGLAARKFARGDRLAVIGDNRPRLYAAMLAAQSLGGAAVPLPPDAEPEWLARVLTDAGVSIVVAEDAGQVETIAAIRAQSSGIRLVVQTTSHGMRMIQHDWLVSFDSLLDASTTPAEQSDPTELALLLYGSETDGIRLSHADLLAAADAVASGEAIRPIEESFAWLPMAWLADALASQALALTFGYTCNCPEHPETVRRDLREIGPTIMLAPPRVWEGMLADIDARAAHATPLKRHLFAHFRKAAERAEQLRESGEALPPALNLRLMLGETLVHAPLRDMIGLRRLRWASSGGEPIPPRVLRGLRAMGINLRQSGTIPEPARPAWEPAHA